MPTFFAAVWADESGEELRVTLFLDVDWQQVVEGQLSVIAMERANSYLAGHVDFSEAIGGVYVRELSFRLEDNLPGFVGSPVVMLINMSGDPKDVIRRAWRVDLEEKHVYVKIVGGKP